MSVRANLVANYAGQGWAALMSILFIPYYIQLLGIEAFGLIGFYAMLQVWLTVLDFGIMPVTTREMARFRGGAIAEQEIHNLLRSLATVILCVALLVGILVWVASGWIGNVWLNPERLRPEAVATAVTLMGAILALRFGEGFYRSCLVGLQRQVSLNIATAAFATLRGAGVLAVLFWVDRSILGFFAWQALVSLLFLATLALLVRLALPRPRRRPRFSRRALSRVWRFGAGMLGINLLALLLTQLDKLLLSRLLPLQDYGYYMLAAAVTGVMYSFVAPITQAIFPAMVEQVGRDSDEALARIFHSGAQMAAAILGPLGLTLIIFSEPLLFAWSGNAALANEVAPLVSLLAGGTLLNILMQVPYHLQLAHGWTSLALWINIVAVLVLAPLLLWAIPIWGVVAAATIWALLNAGYVLVMAPIMFTHLLPTEKWRWYFNDTAKPMAAAAIVLGAARLAPSWDESRIAQGALVGLAAGLAFGAALLSTGAAARFAPWRSRE